MSEAANPYAPPSAPVEDVSPDAAAEETRRAHIGHEASIKAVGILYYLGGVLLAVVAIFGVSGGRIADVTTSVLLLVLAVAQFFAGTGVRRLRPWGRVVGCILSGIGLLGFPIGTVINGYILYLFLSKKGRTIFSEDYQAVIEATPHVKYKTSIVVWIFLALVVGLILLAVLVPFFAR